MNNLFQKLANVQNELKAPKNQRNTFGKYNYRSKEDILEAAKPLCIKHGLVLTITDELLLIGDRYYIKSTAAVTETDSKEIPPSSFSVDAYARESSTKKGMDDSQITGAASSYSGKYALNNLFGIDDTNDADAINIHAGENNKQTAKEVPKAETPAPTAKTSGKADAKKTMTDVQRDSFLKGVSEGRFDLVEKHLKNYAVDAKSKVVTAALNKAKSGK